MFSKLKQYKDMRSQAKRVQGALAEEFVEVEKNGVRIKMNGNLEVLSVNIETGAAAAALAPAIKDCFNEAIKKTQRIMAEKLQSMGGIDNLKF